MLTPWPTTRPSFPCKQIFHSKLEEFRGLKLELKLASDKIKSGNFNMVKIYLDGLTPRITKIWTKIAKTPKKLEIKLVDAYNLEIQIQKFCFNKRGRNPIKEAGWEKFGEYLDTNNDTVIDTEFVSVSEVLQAEADGYLTMGDPARYFVCTVLKLH